MRLLLALLLFGVFFAVPLTTHAQTRHALVIGIDDYDHVEPLKKARNDARAVHEALQAAGFEADLLLDSDGFTMLQALEQFTERLEQGDEAVFFFAGHGLELEGENILLPTDIPAPERGGDLLVRRFGIPVQDVLDQIQRQEARLSLLILDACRDNPFPRQGTRSLGGTRGLARMEAPEGAYIMYSAGAGQAALDRLSDDDPDPNSVFTRALLPRLYTPGLRLRDIVLEVRSEVRQKAMSVGHDQFPAVYDQLDGEFRFLPAAMTHPDDALRQPRPTDACADAALVWSRIRSSENREALDAFVTQYDADCPVLAVLARERIEQLDQVALPRPDRGTVAPGDKSQEEVAVVLVGDWEFAQHCTSGRFDTLDAGSFEIADATGGRFSGSMEYRGDLGRVAGMLDDADGSLSGVFYRTLFHRYNFNGKLADDAQYIEGEEGITYASGANCTFIARRDDAQHHGARADSTQEGTEGPSISLAGMTLRDVEDEERRQSLWPRSAQGLIVLDVATGSEAHLRGARQGDLILRAEGERVSNLEELQAVIDDRRAAGQSRIGVRGFRDYQSERFYLRLN